jgi:cyclohexanone monooxygenase
MTPEWNAQIKANYDEIIAKCRNHVFGMAFNGPRGRNLVDTPPEEVEKILDEFWSQGSFRFVFETFDDLVSNAESNRVVGDFVIRKTLARVKDPQVAEMLRPKDHPFFAKRPPLDHGYFEAYNRDNVKLVDIGAREPLVEITETGIRTTKQHYEFDIIVLATGFQAYTGAQEALQIRGRNGLLLKDKWADVSSSIMGVFVADFPNLFMITGPQAPFANLPTSIEQNVVYIVDCLKKMEREGYALCKPKRAAEEAWVAHTADIHRQTPMAQGDRVHSWMMGANVPDKKPRVLIYFGGANVYYDKLQASANGGFPEVEFERRAG